MHSPGCINTLPSCQTLITLITESVISSRKITLTLSVHQRCPLTYSNTIVFLHSPGCINILPTCQNLITLITESGIHRRNTPSARVPLLTAPSAGSIYLFAQFPTPARVLLSRGLSGGSSKPPTHCSRQAFEATFDKLQLIRTTLISKMIKTL